MRLCCRAKRIVSGLLVVVPMVGQTPHNQPDPRAYKVPNTPYGQPDLEGIWTNATLTPLERPRDLGDKQFFSPEEALEYEKKAYNKVERYRPDDATGTAVLVHDMDKFWRDQTRVVPTLRTSLIIDPQDGRIPPFTPEGKKRAAAAAVARKEHGLDGPESRSALERCIAASNAGPPIMPADYNSNYQIVQSKGYVVVVSEQIHDARLIPLDGRPHLSRNVRQWAGDSRGHWEGKTLVVETTNFTGKTNFETTTQPHIPNTSEALRIVERFTRIAADTIRYDFTVDDPIMYSRPWTGELFLQRTAGPVLEYACHEGNYPLANLLSGAREQEREAGK
jgi:hypothetical protein